MTAPDGPEPAPGAPGRRDLPGADVVIRGARRADALALVPLYAEWDHPATAAVVEAVLDAWARHDDRVILVAEVGDVLAGMAAVSAVPHLSRPGCGARLVGLVVGRNHRRRGMASALVGAAERHARGWGCDQIELTSGRFREEAHLFYPARGYEETSGHHARYLKRLGPS
ncbi:GNAT family N-acetyltransferase [Nakamurella sp.]|uniref:GNAT family N-acetyltransferase n=1 Tax=Nakamurella sp. TaxID=1869182 RepID=UPI003783258A